MSAIPQIRAAREQDAEAACEAVRRSIAELCAADHRGDAVTLALWLANKTPDNMRRWIRGPRSHVLVAVLDGRIAGAGSILETGRVVLNYVSPDARLRGVSKALLAGLEARATVLGLCECTLDSTATARRFYLAQGYRETGPPVPGFGISVGYPMAKLLSR